MNLVKQILDQLSGSASNQLGSLLGMDAAATERAAGAVVPSMLSALAGMTSTDEGTRTLSSALSGLDTSGLGNLNDMLSGNASSVLNSGTSLLGSLFGENTVSSLSNALSRFTGLGANTIRTLMAYLLPMVLGKVATHWKIQGGTSQALQNMFATQRDNIANVLPAGLSLDDVPGIGVVRKPTPSVLSRAEGEPAGATSLARWVLPIAALLIAAFFLWQYFARPGDEQAADNEPAVPSGERVVMRPEIPPIDVQNPTLSRVRENLTGLFETLGTTLTDIRDATTAERARPTLNDLNARIDSIDQVLPRLPEADRAALRPMLEEHVKTITEKANAVGSVPGIGPEIKTLIQEIVAKLSRWISSP